MANGWTITIIGVDTLGTNTIDTEANIKALDANYVQKAFTIYGMNPEPKYNDGDAYVALNGMSFSKLNHRYEFEISVVATDFPSTATDYQEYYGMDLMKKRYHYLDFGDYKLVDEDWSAGNYMLISINDITVEHDWESGQKSVKIKCQKGVFEVIVI